MNRHLHTTPNWQQMRTQSTPSAGKRHNNSYPTTHTLCCANCKQTFPYRDQHVFSPTPPHPPHPKLRVSRTITSCCTNCRQTNTFCHTKASRQSHTAAPIASRQSSSAAPIANRQSPSAAPIASRQSPSAALNCKQTITFCAPIASRHITFCCTELQADNHIGGGNHRAEGLKPPPPPPPMF